jgi:hypothetical protein
LSGEPWSTGHTVLGPSLHSLFTLQAQHAAANLDSPGTPGQKECPRGRWRWPKRTHGG